MADICQNRKHWKCTERFLGSFSAFHDVVRTNYVHQLNACYLDILMHKAFQQRNITDASQQWDFIYCQEHMKSKNPTLKYWSLVLEVLLHLLLFLTAMQNRNFKLYLISIERTLPWFFSLVSQNYASWLSVHFYDMNMLPRTNPDVKDTFINEENLIISRTANGFSPMGIDQCHQQLNRLVKGDAGATGLMEDEDILREWMVCGTEVARIVLQFEENSVLKRNTE